MLNKISRREQWIDIAKGIGIFMVVLGHVTQNVNLIRIIYAFHMPLFFFLSGWIINKSCGESKFNIRYLKTKIATLILPFIEYRILLVIYWYLIERRFRELDVGPIWFLPVMFFSYVIISCLLPKIKNLKIKWVIFISFVMLLIVGLIFRSNVHNLNAPLLSELYINTIRILVGCSWMVLGMMLNDIFSNLKQLNYCIVIVCVVIAWGSLSLLNGEVSLFNLQFGKSYILYYLEGISGIIAVLIVSKIINKNTALEYLGKSSMVIMAFHEPIKRVIFTVYNIVILKIVGRGTHEVIRTTVIGSVILSIITLIVCISMIYILRKLIEKLPDRKWREILFAFMR